MDFFDSLRKALLAGLGAQDKVREFIDELVKKGELSESQGAKLTREWTEKASKSSDEFGKTMSDAVSRVMDKMNLSTKGDMEKLHKEMKALSARIKKLEESKGD